MVTANDWIHPICEAFIRGAGELGIPCNPDYNGASQAGAGYYQRTIHNGRRISAASAFLRPARRKANLEVRTDAQATRIVFEGLTAVGIEYFRGNSSQLSVYEPIGK